MACRLDPTGVGFCGGTPIACRTCSTCDPIAGCQPTIATACLPSTDPSRTLLVLRKGADGSSDKVVWKWTKGTATDLDDLAFPSLYASYEMCVSQDVGGTPALVLGAYVPSGVECSPSDDCEWIPKGNPYLSTGFVFRAVPPYAPEGVKKVRLLPGADGAAKIIVKGNGANLGLPTSLDLTGSVLAQVRNSTGTCWEASYDQPRINRADLHKAKEAP